MNFPAGIYRHYKGGLYQALGIAELSDNGYLQSLAKEKQYLDRPTGKLMVVYISLDATLAGPRMRVRSYDEWSQMIQWPDGAVRPRFLYIGITAK